MIVISTLLYVIVLLLDECETLLDDVAVGVAPPPKGSSLSVGTWFPHAPSPATMAKPKRLNSTVLGREKTHFNFIILSALLQIIDESIAVPLLRYMATLLTVV